MAQKFVYVAILTGVFLFGMIVSWTAFGRQIDSDAYDFIFRLHQPQPWTPDSIILAEDDESFAAFGGILQLRQAFADGLNRIHTAHPAAVAMDLILAEPGNQTEDAALEAAFRETPHLVLESHLDAKGTHWIDPLPRFQRWAAAIGQVHAEPDQLDAINREIRLEKVAGNVRRWALALEAFRVSRGATILESPDDLQVGDVTIPSASRSGRTMRVRYATPQMGGIPQISLKQLAENPQLAEQFRGKVVFAGVTAQAAGDRWMTPFSASLNTPGVEIHANAFETIAHRLFLTSAPLSSVCLVCAVAVASAGLIFAWLEGWQANALALILLLTAHVLPYWLFGANIVFPYAPVVICAWLAVVTAAGWQHVVVRRLLGQSETARAQYRETMQFVTHEMKTPLTAIQGSSELISRYAMPDDKRKQMANMINAESKRLAQMIETFLNVERLSAGQMQLKQEPFSPEEIMGRCVDRVRPVADLKSIAIRIGQLPEEDLLGDRELMEYAFYNLLTNAVKYSPPDTTVTVSGERQRNRVQVSVQDQGIGIDPKEARHIFEKFYRTKTAEQSGEKGTGIGLSIVEQIILQHGGSIAVDSEVGKGSKFTVTLPYAN